jgi:hypothetical protein
MKTPRIEDFDPNAPQVKKQPTLKSSLDNMPSIEIKPKSHPQKRTPNPQEETVSQHHDTVIPRHHETMTPAIEGDPIEIIRTAVKHFGKESATQRLTIEEKQDLREIEFTYLKQGIHTTGNEIIRIAINSLVLDYKQYGENSVLANVLKKLNS